MKPLLKKLCLAACLTCITGAASARDLVMGLIPAENNEELIKHFEPMRAHLEHKLGVKVKMFTATDYAGVIEAMRKKRLDIAWLGPLSYILAEKEAGAEAFAVGVNTDGSSTYRSIYVVPQDSPARTLEDLKGKSVAFVEPASTSGNLVPSFMLKQRTGQTPAQFFGKFTYAGSHDAAQMAVKNHAVDAIAANDISYKNLLAKGMISEQSNRILETSAPIPDSPLTYRQDLDPALKQKIREAFYEAHKEIQVSGYGKFVRYTAAKPADYQPIRDMISTLGLGRDALLK
ncbi:phosphonate ABC transporter substrate-binding protein [Pseudomonas sp. R5(2019)]|uniref:phosphonate ABC transporter substrate-binding protein n=1 Tax=Pseudomonas sp. R5(2019) TaxID=2697566 RepID=UPI0014122994|nr:phosphonate ABC transporter substrate-binding protein [Pseudomonas sp. R5(2019)]NBA95860.1 phosphonate ABC transporter substrate-binding protein [Pseudomonas sp. R5(2019)]